MPQPIKDEVSPRVGSITVISERMQNSFAPLQISLLSQRENSTAAIPPAPRAAPRGGAAQDVPLPIQGGGPKGNASVATSAKHVQHCVALGQQDRGEQRGEHHECDYKTPSCWLLQQS